MVELASGWNLSVERGPNWLFVKLLEPAEPMSGPALADELWDLLQQHLVNRVVLELDEVEPSDDLAEQLAKLHQRIAEFGGQLRVCGLNPDVRDRFQQVSLNCDYDNRTDAVLSGFRPTLPR